MKNFNLSKRIIIGLIIIWNIFLLITYFFPGIGSSIRALINYNIHVAKYDGICEKELLCCNAVTYLINIFSSSIICIFLILFLFNKKYLIYTEMTVSIQTIFNILLFMWAWYLIDVYKEKLIVDIKIWVILSVIFVVIISNFIIKRKWFNFFFIVATLIQFINTYFLLRRNFLALSHFNVLFFCFYGLVIYVLYWALLILDKHSRQAKVD